MTTHCYRESIPDFALLFRTGLFSFNFGWIDDCSVVCSVCCGRRGLGMAKKPSKGKDRGCGNLKLLLAMEALLSLFPVVMLIMYLMIMITNLRLLKTLLLIRLTSM